MPAVGPILKEITCIIGGVLVIFSIDNPLAKLCPKPTTITVTSGVSKTTTASISRGTSSGVFTSATATTTISVGSSTSIVLPGSSETLTVPTTTSSGISNTTSPSTTVPTTSSVATSSMVSTTSAISVSSTAPATSSTLSSSIAPTTSSILTSSTTTSTSSTSAASPTGYDAFNCPAGLPYSCQNTTAIQDTCCFESPGGLILQTQFWDTNPATGPDNSWTIHGLWPDNCDGTYEQYCDPVREYTNITQILQSFGDQDLVDYMNTYWTSNSGSAESFWEHEWGKHGTCMSTFDTQCYPSYKPTQEIPDFFQRTVDIFKQLPSYDWLAAADIVPSTTATYTAQQIQDALSSHHGGKQVYLGCAGGNQLDELWYYFYVQGSIQDGNLMPTEFGSSSCPATGIRYYPKGYVPPTSTKTASPTSATSACSTATATPFAGKGYLYVYNSAGTQQGFVISAGKWYNTAGTPATFTSNSASGQGPFTLTTSKGLCVVQADSSLFCDASVTTGSPFNSGGSNLQFNGSDTFGATSTPTGTAQGTIYASGAQPVSITIQWVSRC